jgi:hypothetical protein
MIQKDQVETASVSKREVFCWMYRIWSLFSTALSRVAKGAGGEIDSRDSGSPFCQCCGVQPWTAAEVGDGGRGVHAERGGDPCRGAFDEDVFPRGEVDLGVQVVFKHFLRRVQGA